MLIIHKVVRRKIKDFMLLSFPTKELNYNKNCINAMTAQKILAMELTYTLKCYYLRTHLVFRLKISVLGLRKKNVSFTLQVYDRYS